MRSSQAQPCSGTGALPSNTGCYQRSGYPDQVPRSGTLLTAIRSLYQGQGEVAGGTLHMDITEWSELEKSHFSALGRASVTGEEQS